MIKIIPPDAYSFGEDMVKQIKIASSGLRGSDLTSFIKRAGHEFADKVKKLKFEPGEVPIHLIALGTTESVGPNRNGDGFKSASCKKYHNTFTKYARWYRNHKNRDESKSYGVVKLSSYNEPMQRIELIVALNGTKQAADKNGGLVADQEVELLEKQADIPVSMACHVKYDTCSSCGNNARSRDEYCKGIDEGGLCKHGGLKNNIGVTCEDGHQLHADNPHPKFFDISKVIRGADRTAFVLGKAASSNTECGASLAEMFKISAPYYILDESDYSQSTLDQIKLAHKLARYESNLRPSELDSSIYSLSIPNIEQVTHVKLAEVLEQLSRDKIVLPVKEWLYLTTNPAYKKFRDRKSVV